jgi:hypothetical protein
MAAVLRFLLCPRAKTKETRPTSGHSANLEGKEGIMNGVVFRYFSLSIETYRRVLGDQGLTLVNIHEDKGGNTYYLATKSCEAHG